MPLIYGKGSDNAFTQLWEEIDKPLKGKHTTLVNIQHSSQGER
jgi:hypothetical protein